MEGRLIGVGVGPGDPELLTLAAVRAIRESDCILLPNEKKEECYAYKIVRQVVPEIEEKEICPMQFPMTKDADVLRAAQERCFAKVQTRMMKGKKLVFLTIGDPSVYSTYHYIHRRVLAAGMSATMISGVPSFCAVAARLGISLADQGEEIHIIPGSYAVADMIDYTGTRIYMKSGKKLKQLIDMLRTELEGREQQGETLEIYGVSNCGLPDEIVMQGVDALTQAVSYLTIVIVKVKKQDKSRYLQ